MKRTILACALAVAGCGSASPASHEQAQLLSAPQLYPASRFTALVYAADVTGDGNVDLFVSSQAAEAPVVSVLAGDGNGHFAAPLKFRTFAPQEMVSGDFEGRGVTDIIGVNYDGMGALPLFELRGDGAGGFALTLLTASHYWSGSIGTADFTSDGLPDVIVPYQVDFPPGGGVVILAAPDFHQVEDLHIEDARFGTEIAVGDFNNDGHADAILTLTQGTPHEGQIAFLAGDGAGHLAAPVYFPATLTNTRPVVADFNEDGNLDVALTEEVVQLTPVAEHIVILLGDGAGGFGPPHAYSTGVSSPLGARGLASADFDEDGHVDLVVGSNDSHLTLMRGNGKGAFSPVEHLSLPTGDMAWNVAAADFDNHCGPDVASVTAPAESIAVFLNE